MKRRESVRLGVISAAMFLAWAQAQEPDTTGPGELEPRLHLSFTPFLWAVNITGDSAVAGVSADVDVSFFDVLDEADRISDLSWQTVAAAGYRTEFLGIPAVTFLGYRALGQDFEDGDFEWDIIAHGPMLGFQMRF